MMRKCGFILGIQKKPQLTIKAFDLIFLLLLISGCYSLKDGVHHPSENLIFPNLSSPRGVSRTSWLGYIRLQVGPQSPFLADKQARLYILSSVRLDLCIDFILRSLNVGSLLGESLPRPE